MKEYNEYNGKRLVNLWTEDIFNYDTLGSNWGSSFVEKKDQESKDLLVDIMMKKYGITISDLDDIDIVKSKLRDVNIEEILK